MKNKTFLSIAATAAATALVLTGCSSDTSDGDNKTLKVGVFNGWDEGIATSYLWKAVLENEGYTVELQNVDAAPLFTGISEGDLDFTTDVWLPVTHEAYIEQYGDKMEDLGSWFDQAALTIAVNEDAPINSLAELADNADLFGSRIVGIESGAGLTKATQEQVQPIYGLESWNLQTSSTASMLTELKAATDAGENIVVTLWEPHWAYSAFPVKNLEDPEGALGAAESIHLYGREGFSEDHAEVATWLKNFEMSPELLYDLEDRMFNQNDDAGQYESIVEQWIADNQEYVDSLTNGRPVFERGPVTPRGDRTSS
jgi:glycine betaine/proline transport system substrate-binding protein